MLLRLHDLSLATSPITGILHCKQRIAVHLTGMPSLPTPISSIVTVVRSFFFFILIVYLYTLSVYFSRLLFSEICSNSRLWSSPFFIFHIPAVFEDLSQRLHLGICTVCKFRANAARQCWFWRAIYPPSMMMMQCFSSLAEA